MQRELNMKPCKFKDVANYQYDKKYYDRLGEASKHWQHFAHDPIYTTGLLLMKACEFAAGGKRIMVNGVKR